MLYTVDRTNSLVEGAKIGLKNIGLFKPMHLHDYALKMFPDGLSHHGEYYFFSLEPACSKPEFMIELLFEQVRRLTHPERPSRFQSMFAVDSIEKAQEFIARCRADSARIFEISGTTEFKANMNLLHSNHPSLATSWYAEQYWAGNDGGHPAFWEYLVSGQVTIGNKVL